MEEEERRTGIRAIKRYGACVECRRVDCIVIPLAEVLGLCTLV